MPTTPFDGDRYDRRRPATKGAREMTPIRLGPRGLTRSEVVAIARRGASMEVAPKARAASARVVERRGVAHAVSAGFGPPTDVVAADRSVQLQTSRRHMPES